MAPPFWFWLGVAIFLPILITKLLKEWKKKDKDWVSIGIIVFMAWVIYAIYFGS